MSQSLETTKTISLGYDEELFANLYYTARLAPGIGVMVGPMIKATMIQFFPWREGAGNGHDRYATWLGDKATSAMAEQGKLFNRWPYALVEYRDMLMIKCVIEDLRNTVEQLNESNTRCPADPSAGETLG